MGGPDAGPARDIVDAEYETIPAPPPRSGIGTGPTSATALAGLDLLRRGGAGAGGGLHWALGALVAAGAFWISGGHAVLGPQEPPAAALRIATAESRIIRSQQGALLLVDGEAVNEGGAAARLPDLSINVLDRNGRTTHYFLGTNARPLAAGERFAFSGRLSAPKEGVKSVSVTFRE